MNVAIFTLYEGDYHFGAASLINSAVKSGFKGKFFLFYRDQPPPWSDQAHQLLDLGVDLRIEACDPPRHLGFHKPFVALELLDNNPELDGVAYADPDVVFVAPWPFFLKWMNLGAALCLDAIFPWLHEKHPWRQEWRALVERAKMEVHRSPHEYPNSGYFAVRREFAEFLLNWKKLTLQYESEGGNTLKFVSQEDPWRSVRGDQDILAASLPTNFVEPAFLGLEGMGFNGYYSILAHAIENPKPWRRSFVAFALRGHRPSISAKLWFENASYPIRGLSDFRRFATKIDLVAALVIARLWKQ